MGMSHAHLVKVVDKRLEVVVFFDNMNCARVRYHGRFTVRLQPWRARRFAARAQSRSSGSIDTHAHCVVSCACAACAPIACWHGPGTAATSQEASWGRCRQTERMRWSALVGCDERLLAILGLQGWIENGCVVFKGKLAQCRQLKLVTHERPMGNGRSIYKSVLKDPLIRLQSYSDRHNSHPLKCHGLHQSSDAR